METRSVLDEQRFFTILAPIHNEDQNIHRFLTGIRNCVDGSSELILVYDSDDDTTLPVIAGMKASDTPAGLRLVKNNIGPGVVNAIRTGFRSAKGDAIVVFMADCSDPFELIEVAAERIFSGADIVAGSRYMRGGNQQGGGVVKSMLSRVAGLALYWLAGLPIHDATTNFRAYSRRVAEQFMIESTGGFEFALELTVKAYYRHGWRVEEFPSQWQDRAAGQSNFRLWRWLPGYLRWAWEAYRRSVFPKSRSNPHGMPHWWVVASLAIVVGIVSSIGCHRLLPWVGMAIGSIVGMILSLALLPPLLRVAGRFFRNTNPPPGIGTPRISTSRKDLETVPSTDLGT